MSNFNLKKFLVENKLTSNSKILKENFAPSPNDSLGAEDANYSVSQAFKKAGIDMTKPVFVIDSEASGLGGDNVDKPRQEDANYIANDLDGERRAYLSEYEEGENFPVYYEYENNTIFPEQIPQGAEYKLCVSFAEIKDYSILQ